MQTSLTHTETHFGLQDFTAENWKNYGGFDELAADVEAWLGHELSEREDADLRSLYWYYVEGY